MMSNFVSQVVWYIMYICMLYTHNKYVRAHRTYALWAAGHEVIKLGGCVCVRATAAG